MVASPLSVADADQRFGVWRRMKVVLSLVVPKMELVPPS
jgi:hypothetical protein